LHRQAGAGVRGLQNQASRVPPGLARANGRIEVERADVATKYAGRIAELQGRLEMTEKVFTARALTKTYASGEVEVRAVGGLDPDVWTGEVVVPLGPSGSGKSTLLNIMRGLDHATSGTILFKNADLTGLDDRALTSYRPRHVGFVFQFYNLIPSLSAYENVALEIADQPMRPDEALALVGLDDRKNHFPAELSGGEQQRVAIARAIAKRPEVLLCDEPTGTFHSKTGICVIEALLRELASVRMLGFSQGEVLRILFLELALLTPLAQPPGWAVGYGLAWTLKTKMAADVMPAPLIVEHSTHALAGAIVLAAAVFSALIVRRRINRLDLVAVLKTTRD
jgi:putative ABC transport system ATP-binding protein